MSDDVDIAHRYIKKSQSSADRGLEFGLSFAEYKKLQTRKFCAYSGIEFSAYKNGKPVDGFRGRTIDRIDNSKGYILGNVVSVCDGINRLKAQWENPNNPLTLDILIKTLGAVKKKIP